MAASSIDALLRRVPKVAVAIVPNQSLSNELKDRFQNHQPANLPENVDGDGVEFSTSSATNARKEKNKRRRGKRSKQISQPAEIEPMEVATNNVMVGRVKETFTVLSFADMYRTFPAMFAHLKRKEMHQFVEAAERATGSAASQLWRKANNREQGEIEFEEQMMLHEESIEEERKHPFLIELFREKTAHLPNVHYLMPLNQTRAYTQDLVNLLQAQMLYLPVATAEFENELLQEAGTFFHPQMQRTYDFPACERGEKCVGKTFCIRGFDLVPGGRGVILTMCFTKLEYDNFLKHERKPLTRRRCVLCMRYHLQDYIMHLRSHGKLVKVDPKAAFQVYRNPCNEPGGYKREYMIMPDSDRYEGIFDGIAEFRRSLLYFEIQGIEYGNRVRVNQDAMIYHHAPPLDVQPGETREDFKKRSIAHKREYEHKSQAMQEDRLRTQDPRRALLRVHPRADQVFMDPRLFKPFYMNLETIYEEAQRKPDLLSPDLSYELCATLDSYHGCETPIADYILPAHLKTTAIQHTVTDVGSLLYRICFWSNTKGKGDKRVHLMCKLLPQPCQTRRFENVCIRYMKQSSVITNDIITWVICGLLGNYDHVAHQERPNLEQRDALNRLLHSSRPPVEWMAFVKALPDVVIFCMRMYLVYAVEERPALCTNVGRLFSWPRFKEIVSETMLKLRELLLPKLVATDNFKEWLSPEDDDETVQTASQICKKAHESILDVSYQRPRKALIDDWFNVCRKYNPKDTMKPDIIDALKGPGRCIQPHHMQPLVELIGRLDPLTINVVRDVIMVLESFGISKASVNCLIDLNRVYETDHAGRRILEHAFRELIVEHSYAFALFSAFCRLWRATHWIQIRELPVHYLVNQVTALRERYDLPPDSPLPESDTELLFCRGCRGVYSLVTSHRVKPCTKHDQPNCKLCHKQYEYGNDCVVTDLRTDKVYCSKAHDTREIEEIYWALVEHSDPLAFVSWVRPGSAPEKKEWYDSDDDSDSEGEDSVEPSSASEAGTPKTKKKARPKKKAKTAATTGATVSNKIVRWMQQIVPDTIDVKEEPSARTQPLAIHRHELERVPILGRIVQINRRLIFCCPQVGCARLCEFNSTDSVYNERGFACRACSERLRYANMREEKHPFLTPDEASNRCAVCFNHCRSDATAFCYPGGIVLCKYHHGNRLAEDVSGYFYGVAKTPTREEVLRKILELRAMYKQQREQRFAKKNKASLLAAKQRSRSNKRR